MDTVDELLDYVFEGKKPALYPEFELWIRGSRRFRAFATTYSSKIRAKLKSARDAGSPEDLRAELQTAAVLLREERFSLEYEKYAASKQRGPDFTVLFKGHTPFNVEVRRIRSVELDDADSQARAGKLMGVLCDKVRQMPPSIVNLLWLTSERQMTIADLNLAVTTLRGLAEQKEEAYFTRRGFLSAADFVKRYRRLSGIVMRQPGKDAIWLNSIARHPVPPEIALAIKRLPLSI